MIEFTCKDLLICYRGVIKPPSGLSKLLVDMSKGRSSPIVKSTQHGHYFLSPFGFSEAQGFITNPDYAERLAQTAVVYLRKIIAKLNEEVQKKFFAEAVSCISVDANRATVIMVWAATINHLYEYIIKHKLAEFNGALNRRADKYARITIASKDDFLDIREHVFIETMRSAGIISNDVRKILDEKLGIRNSCAHPSTIEIRETKVVNFIEDLVENVILKYII